MCQAVPKPGSNYKQVPHDGLSSGSESALFRRHTTPLFGLKHKEMLTAESFELENVRESSKTMKILSDYEVANWDSEGTRGTEVDAPDASGTSIDDDTFIVKDMSENMHN